MKDVLITRLRDKSTHLSAFREAADQLGMLTAMDLSQYLDRESCEVQTPVGGSEGKVFKNKLVFVPILRAGLAMIPSFLRVFTDARVGFVGLERNEETAIARRYYLKLPKFQSDDVVVVLDPMIATGGSGLHTVQALVEHGIKSSQILFASFISSMEGEEMIRNAYPDVRILVAQRDSCLNAQKYIVPGLGDFGDRYFGTEE